MRDLCFGVAAVLLFLAGRASASVRDYVIYGTLRIVSEDESRLIAELRVGNATDARQKIQFAMKPSAVLAAFCHDHANEHLTLTLRPEGTNAKEAH